VFSALAAAVLVGVLHVHHEPSHDSDAPFAALLAGAYAAGLDFLVLAEHVPDGAQGPLPAADRAGIYLSPEGRPFLVMVGAELGTRDGHLLGYQIPRLVPADESRPARLVIDDIHRLGGFAVVPHPLAYGGWRAWDAPFDGIEVHNNAVEFRQELRPWLPFRLVQFAFSRDAAMRSMLDRPRDALDRWETLLLEGRRLLAFSGSDAHQNVKLLGWQLDPYAQVFQAVRTVCSDVQLTPESIWAALRSGRCWIRYSVFEEWAEEDTYFPLEDELAALQSAGFDAQCRWRRASNMVLVGRKRGP
jgi:hypothetical protein